MDAAGAAKKPSEAQEQQALIQWWRLAHGKYGVGEHLLLHVANEGTGSAVRGRIQKRMGLRAGCPDLFLAVPCGEFSGLWLEMKRRDGGRVSPEQADFLLSLKTMGYAAEVCRGAEKAIQAIDKYLRQ